MKQSLKLSSVLFLAFLGLSLIISSAEAVSIKLVNQTNPIDSNSTQLTPKNQTNQTQAPPAPQKPKPTGLVFEKFGSFCGKKTKQCAAYCKNNKGESMDENTLDSFMCYVSKEVAGPAIACKNDDDCNNEQFKAIGKHCSKITECQGVARMSKM